LWDTIRHGEVWRGELVNRRKDGTLYHEEMGVTPLTDESGTITHYVAIKQDVSARKRAEEALSNSEQRLTLALAAGGHGAWEIDFVNGRVVASSRACEIFGITDPQSFQTLGQWVDLVVEEDREASEQALRRAASGVTGYLVEFRVRRASDGAIRWVSFIGNLVRPGTLIGIATDITERKQAEHNLTVELHALTRLHELATLSIQDGRLEPVLAETLDAAMDLGASDCGTIQLFDAHSSDLKMAIHRGLPQWWVDFWNGPAKAHGASSRALRQQERVIVEDVERSDVFGDPVLRDTQLKAGIRAMQSTPLVTRTGQPVGCFSTHYKSPHRPDERTLRVLDLLAFQAADIIAKTRAESALRESEERLGRANDELAESARRKNEFIAVLSHELRNPLAPIRYALPVLQREPLNEGAVRAVHVIDRQVGHLTRLVDDLLDVSRITRGKIELRQEPVTVGSIVSAAIEAASPAIAAARHSLEVVVPEEPIWVRADRARIGQVLTNLLDNAAKYTPRGGRIRVEAAHDNGTAVIRVEDNGVGISSEALPTIFEMFLQVKAPQRGSRAGDPASVPDLSRGGLGIGLALVRQLVDMHEGTVEAHSAGIGHGAEFIVRLPASDPGSAQELVRAATDATTSGRRLKVLVVDDNVDLVEMLAIVVEGLGHDVRKALDGRTAISAATAYRPDVVLLDLGLPVISGIDVARQLRQRPETAHVYLVALTGWGQAEDRARTREAGFDHHLTKPTDPRALEQLLYEVAKAS
jgi:PAS domain S-box-containing protein